MANPIAPPLPDGCPWSGFTPPNVDWCELERCAWVVNPADTWSNLAYVVFGLLMIAQARRMGGGVLYLFGPASVLVGLFSGIYHASHTYMLQFLDFVGMFVFCFLVLALNARRLAWIRPEKQTLVFVAGVVGFSALVPPLFRLGVPIQGLVLVLVIAIIVQETLLRRWDGRDPARRYFLAALLLIGVGATFSALDVTRTFCEPESWLQGHAIWHVTSAACLYALFHFYARLRPGEGAA